MGRRFRFDSNLGVGRWSETFGELRSRGIEEWVEEIANHVSSDFAEHLRAHRDAVRKPFLLSTVSDHLEPWSNPGVMVIGDAVGIYDESRTLKVRTSRPLERAGVSPARGTVGW